MPIRLGAIDRSRDQQAHYMKNIFSQFFDSLFGSGKAWWVEVTTGAPVCTYYFGPFDTAGEAEIAKQGYVDDLEQEGAKQVAATVVHRKEPQDLTIEDKKGGAVPKSEPALSGQP